MTKTEKPEKKGTILGKMMSAFTYADQIEIFKKQLDDLSEHVARLVVRVYELETVVDQVATIRTDLDKLTSFIVNDTDLMIEPIVKIPIPKAPVKIAAKKPVGRPRLDVKPKAKKKKRS